MADAVDDIPYRQTIRDYLRPLAFRKEDDEFIWGISRKIAEAAPAMSRAVVSLAGDSLSRYATVAGPDMPGANIGQPGRQSYEIVHPLNFALARIGQRIDFPIQNNVGKGGIQTWEILERTALNSGNGSSIYIIGGGTNDIPSYADMLAEGNIEDYRPAEETIANIKSACLAARSYGCAVIYMGIPPRQTWSGREVQYWPAMQAQRRMINQEIREWCATQDRIYFWDMDLDIARYDLIQGVSAQNGATFTNNAAGTPDTVLLPIDDAWADAEDDDYLGMWLQLYHNNVPTVRRMIIGNDAATRTLELLGDEWQTTGSTVLSCGPYAVDDAVVTRHDGGSFITDGFVTAMPIVLTGFAQSSPLNSSLKAVLSDSQIVINAAMTSEAPAAGRVARLQTPSSTTNFAIDPAGIPKKGYLADLLHFDIRGSYAGSHELTRILSEIVPERASNCSRGGDSRDVQWTPRGNILRNGLFVGVGGAPGLGTTGVLAAGWRSLIPFALDSGGTAVWSLETDEDGVPCQVLTLTAKGGGANVREQFVLRQEVPADINSFAAGDRLAFWGEIRVMGISGIRSIALSISAPRDDTLETNGVFWGDTKANVSTTYWPDGDLGLLTVRPPVLPVGLYTSALVDPTLDLRFTIETDPQADTAPAGIFKFRRFFLGKV